MYDPRFNKMAQVLVNYSLEVKPGETVYVWSTTLAQPLMLEIYREVLKAGGNAFLRADLPGAMEMYYQYAEGKQLDFVSPVDQISVDPKQFQHYVRIGAEYNSRRLSNADANKMQRQQTAQRPVLNQRMELSAQNKYNWVVTQFPTEAYAMDADMSLDEYKEFVFSAALLNDPDPVARWKEIGKKQEAYTDYLKSKDVITVQGSNMDLTLRVKGRIWKNSQGKRNFPDGEVYTGPIEDSVNGWINYTYPGIYQGREVDGIRLEFTDGRVVKATAKKNEAFLNKVLDTDVGARTLGEFAIGTNYGITKFSKNILFDEKIGGTIHMACGSAYPDTLAVNKSAVHWDMIAGAQDAEIRADGELFYKDGMFLI
jgi:aminopeptidase